MLGQVLAILLITLALDYLLLATVFSGMKKSWADAATAYTRAYISVPWHHDLAPNANSQRAWGNVSYAWRTDRYGFRIGECAPGEAEKSWPAIFVIGDSFTEGIGSSYENSFAGRLACAARKQGKALWNLGVASFSPVIYWRKIEAAAVKLGVKPQEIWVFLDLSDTDDDANVYREAADGTVKSVGWSGYDIGQFLLGNFATFRVLYNAYLDSPLATMGSVGRERGRWTMDKDLQEKWANRGLETEGRNLDRIVGLCRDWGCRMTLVVYPWPDSVAAGDRDSLQVRHWKQWAAERKVRFVDGFAPFFNEPGNVALHKYFIPGDVHFNAAGHRLLYDEVVKLLGEE